MTYTVSSRALSVKIDPESGRLLRVRNLARDLDLIAGTPANPPFRLELAKVGVVESFEDFHCEPLANG